MKRIAFILAGGSDLKFWPRSLKNIPKQFVHLYDNTTLFQKTLTGIRKQFADEDIWIIVNKDYKDLVVEQAPDFEEKQIICEPLSRHTAAAIAFTLSILSDKYPDDTVISIFPSDHFIRNYGEFYSAIEQASFAAFELEGIITIGIQPTRPETQYGYIQYDNENLTFPNRFYELGLRKSVNFAEKPDKFTAQRFVNSGDFAWNSGILIVRIDVLRKAFERFLNYHFKQFNSLKKYRDKKNFEEKATNIYKTLNKMSIDYGILENADNVYVLKATFDWTDLSNWDEIFRVQHKDARDNVILGNVITLNTKNSMLISDEKPIGAVGIEDIIVINTEKALLICKRGESDDVGELVEYMKKLNIPIY